MSYKIEMSKVSKRIFILVVVPLFFYGSKVPGVLPRLLDTVVEGPERVFHKPHSNNPVETKTQRRIYDMKLCANDHFLIPTLYQYFHCSLRLLSRNFRCLTKV